MNSEKIKMIVTGALFVALDIIIARFFTFELPTPLGPVKFDFQLVVAALCGFALGPLWGSLTLVGSDILGALLNGGSLGFFFGFTLTAFMRGVIFGLLLYKKEPKIPRLVTSSIIAFFICDFCMNTLWLSMILGTPYFPFLAARIIPKAVLLAADILLISCLKKLFNSIVVPAPKTSQK